MKYLERFYERAFDWLLVFGPRILIALVLLAVGFWVIRIVNKWL